MVRGLYTFRTTCYQPLSNPVLLEKYSFFTIEDFIHDDYFRSWVLSSHPETDHFWLDFQKLHPERKAILLAARALFISLHLAQSIPTDEQGRQMWAVINEATAPGASIEVREEVASGTVRPVWRWLSVAAAVLTALGLGWFVFLNNAKKPASLAGQIGKETLSAIEKNNFTNRPQYVRLSDGSRIILYPGSRIRYTDPFEGNKREIFLSGKGYFEVTKDDSKPFIVYANRLVTQVVGTSFIIDAFAGNKSPSVEVRTGNVQVFLLEKFRDAQRGKPQEMILLSANEQIRYDLIKKSFAPKPIPKPNQTNAPLSHPDFNFQNEAITDVFKTLEVSYGVTIEYNQQTLKNCSITARLDNEPLFRQLDVVCQTIGAKYEVFETRIVVSGPSCAL